jgi:superfamily II DNA or RNA helicase
VIYGKTLLAETREKLAVYLNEPIGLIAGKEFSLGRVTCASINTVYARLHAGDPVMLELLNTVKLIVTEECHRSSSMVWIDVLQAVQTPFRLGTSGTPLKHQDLPDLSLVGFIGPLLYGIPVKELQDAGYLSHATLTILEITKPAMPRLRRWPDVLDKLIIHNASRTQQIVDLVLSRARQGKKVFVLAGNTLDLAHDLFNGILAENSGTELLTGKTFGNQDALKRFRAGISNVLVATVVIDEGIDAPDTNVVVLAGGGKSFVKSMQRIGRGLRVKRDGGTLEVVDVVDSTNPTLRKHALARLKYYDDAELFQSVSTITDGLKLFS